jgi:hypothetical protein
VCVCVCVSVYLIFLSDMYKCKRREASFVREREREPRSALWLSMIGASKNIQSIIIGRDYISVSFSLLFYVSNFLHFLSLPSFSLSLSLSLFSFSSQFLFKGFSNLLLHKHILAGSSSKSHFIFVCMKSNSMSYLFSAFAKIYFTG